MRYSLFLLIIILFSQCNSSKNESQELIDFVEEKPDYFYEPEKSTITGVIDTLTSFGPPGYGEDPENDSRELNYYLNLLQNINVTPKDSSSDSFNVPHKGVSAIQLSSPKIDLKNFVGHTVHLHGTLFGAHTGHHHRDVLMAVEQITQ